MNKQMVRFGYSQRIRVGGSRIYTAYQGTWEPEVKGGGADGANQGGTAEGYLSSLVSRPGSKGF
jgi:hypothetical protein